MLKRTRILLVEDHFLARMALHSVLSMHENLHVVGQAVDGEQGIAMYRELLPDIVLLDLRLPRLSGFEVLAKLRKEFPQSRCIILSSYQGSEDIYRVLRGGAMGYLTKDASGDEVLNAIEAVGRDLRYIPPAVLNRLAERMPATDLTPREAEVLTCITRGLSNREIADELHIAEKTVRVHVSAVLEKVGARDRTQATIFALQRGIVHLDQA
jgi:DNA-binding NarL/FixJ family response regulator